MIASCSDANRVPKLLRSTGRLDNVIEVGTPSTSERCGIIVHMLRVRGLVIDTDTVEHVARKTEGCDAGDLSVLIERAVQTFRMSALFARGGGCEKVTTAHWEEALRGFQPAAAWHASTQGRIDARCACRPNLLVLL